MQLSISFAGDLVTSQDLHNVLLQISEIDRRVKSRVIESGILYGVKFEDIQRVSELLTLQDGCVDYFHKLKGGESKIDAKIHIVSYCWSDDIIKSSFSSGNLLPVTFLLACCLISSWQTSGVVYLCSL